MHLTKLVFFFLFLFNLFWLTFDLNVTPDLGTKLSLHSVCKLIETNILIGDLRGSKLNCDIDSLPNFDSVTYCFLFLSKVGTIDKDQPGVLRPGEFTFIDKGPSLFEHFTSFEFLALAKTL